MKSPRQSQRDLEERRAEREFFFWTAFKYLKLIVIAVLVANLVFYDVASLIQGDPPGWEPLLRLLL